MKNNEIKTMYNAQEILTTISNQIASEDKTHRFYALQWLWDFVAVNAKDGKVKLTNGQYAILAEV
jgi:ribosome-associated toxin RatA of RatAB toxin-antitoxin module